LVFLLHRFLEDFQCVDRCRLATFLRGLREESQPLVKRLSKVLPIRHSQIVGFLAGTPQVSNRVGHGNRSLVETEVPELLHDIIVLDAVS
jgi:hypothetical protein